MGKKRPKSKASKQLPPPNATIESYSSESIAEEMIAAAMSSVPHQTVLLKVCRLCETKDGPFLNIFDADKVTIKKIEEVMPFGIAENDDLPHKICFRCSAKVEELFEFIQKCVKTQQSLRTAMGKESPLVTKTKTRALWEEKLNKTNLSNDDICNALIKKAMEGIKSIPLSPLPLEEDKLQQPSVSKQTKANTELQETSKKDKELIWLSSKSSIMYQSDDDDPDEVSLKQVKLAIEKCDDQVPSSRSSRSKKSDVLLDGLSEPPKKLKHYPTRKSHNRLEPAPVDIQSTNDEQQSEDQNTTVVSENRNKDKSEKVKEKPIDEPAKIEEAPAPINIMDHVSTIKVNRVGTLYLCKLCNRNFLKKDVVMTHGCAKNNVPKDSFLQNQVPRPDVPKPSTVKYIKIDKDFKKSVVPENIPVENKSASSDCIRVNIPVRPEAILRPKAGPASRVKLQRQVSEEPTPPLAPISTSASTPSAAPKPNISQTDKPIVPSVQFPNIPSLNSRYKLVPGPNNTFTLVEDSDQQNIEKPAEESVPAQPTSKKRRATNANNVKNPRYTPRTHADEVIDLDDNIPSPPQPIQHPYPVGQPYPVGLFQTVAHHSRAFAPKTHQQPPAFTTPAIKKQSYTIVQTGNPSKLLISTKPQPVQEELPRKKSRKTKLEVRELNKESNSVTLEGNPPPKEDGFFTFINVDPLLQPSYVLPTDNIIQESQISTSTPASKAILECEEKDNKYGCNMCGERFSREKKLLAHIQSHYNRMDEEDQLRAEKPGPKKRVRKL